MPRPNHDLPSHLIGGVKDYAREHDISTDEAHARLLAYSLKKAGVIGCPEDVADDVPDIEIEESNGG
jgi:hypothetical protein